MSGWNLADIMDAVAQAHPDAPAQAQGDRATTWADLDRRASAVAAALVERGARRQEKVAQYLYNGPEYLETVVGSFKSALVPVNTNYRYQDAELLYLWDNADVVAVAFHGAFTERIEGLRARLPKIHTWLWVDDGSGPRPDWALDYEEIAESGARASARLAVASRRRRSAAALHRRHHRHSQGRDVAPGRSASDLQPRAPAGALRPDSRHRSASASRRRPRDRAESSCRRARSCTAPASSPGS